MLGTAEEEWLPFPADQPFPGRFQGEWKAQDGLSFRIADRQMQFDGRDIAVGELALWHGDGDAIALRNDGPDDPVTGRYWAEDTLFMIWFNPGEDEIQLYGLGAHRSLERYAGITRTENQ